MPGMRSLVEHPGARSLRYRSGAEVCHVQGACKGPPPSSVLKSAETAGENPGKVDLSEFRQGQCVITLGGKLEPEDLEKSRLWLDNLFLVYRRQRDRPAAQITGNTVYITNCTVQAEKETSLRVDSAYIEGMLHPLKGRFPC
jgi:hypothetical protein